MVKEILVDFEKSPNNLKIKHSNENFLLNLLKEDDSSLIPLIKTLDIKKEDFIKIIKNIKDISKKQNLLTKIDQLFEMKDKNTKADINKILISSKIQNSKDNIQTQKNFSLSANLSDIKSFHKNDKFIDKEKHQDFKHIEFSKNFLEDISSLKLPQNIEYKITEIVKKEITSKINLKNNITIQKTIKEFKNIKTLKKLIKFAKETLNLKKIEISIPSKQEITDIIKNSQINPSNNISPKPKIILQKKIQKQNIIHTKTKPLKTVTLSSKDIPKTVTFSLKNIPKTNNITISEIIKSNLKSKNTTSKKPVTPTKTNQKQIFTNTKQTITSIIKPNLKEILQNFHTASLKQKTVKFDTKSHFKDEIKISYKKNPIKNNILTSPLITEHLKEKIVTAKDSIKHFATNLKEEITNYKPPLSKVSLELHPKELGKVEVTIIHRGDNLHIQVNGQNQTINFFNANQQELRQALVNMGFNDVNMSFNQQNQQGKKEYKQNQKYLKDEETDEMIIEIPYQYA